MSLAELRTFLPFSRWPSDLPLIACWDNLFLEVVETSEEAAIFESLKQKKIFRVAALYSVIAWVILQLADIIKEPLNLPDWFMTTVITLLVIGFFVALAAGWLSTTDEDTTSPTNSTRSGFESILLILVVLGLGWLIVKDLSLTQSDGQKARTTPVVILMDTFAPRGVYDEETRKKSGTNADVLSDVLSDLNLLTQKETLGSTWDRESQVLKQRPDLILIHRSAFFHSMARDFELTYPAEGEAPSARFRRLYGVAENKLIAFLGYIGDQSPNTHFVIYSRGTGGGWPDLAYRREWLSRVSGRFPSLQNRVTAIPVPGGVASGSFQSEKGRAVIRALVLEQLGRVEPESPH